MLRNEGDRLTKVAVCSPRSEYFRVDNLEAHNIREVANQDLAKTQHAALTDLLAERGVEVIDIGECPGHPNSVFTRDMAVGAPDGYIRASMGIPTRVGEERWMADALDHLGEPGAGEIGPPGTVEGGDVVLAGRVAFVGRTRRTNPEGIRQMTVLLGRMGMAVRVVPLPETCLHLDQAVGVLGPDRLMVCRNIYDEELFRGYRTVLLPCQGHNVNFICLAPDEIVVPASNLPLIDAAERNGVLIHALDFSEFAKGTGGPNCLIMPIERLENR
jgi:dimethylargininase